MENQEPEVVVNQEAPVEKEPASASKLGLIILTILILLILLTVGGSYLLISRNNETQTPVTVQVSIAPTETTNTEVSPTGTPVPTVSTSVSPTATVAPSVTKAPTAKPSGGVTTGPQNLQGNPTSTPTKSQQFAPNQ